MADTKKEIETVRINFYDPQESRVKETGNSGLTLGTKDLKYVSLF